MLKENNHIEFFNPGALPDSISIEQLISGNYTSQTRNKKIASIFKEAGVIEKYGSGIKRIRDAFLSYGLKEPIFENFQHGFRVLVVANIIEVVDKVVDKVVDRVVDKLNLNQIRIIELLKQNQYISANELSKMIGISQRKVQDNLSKLKLMKKIKRVGSNKSGHWEIVE